MRWLLTKVCVHSHEALQLTRTREAGKRAADPSLHSGREEGARNGSHSVTLQKLLTAVQEVRGIRSNISAQYCVVLAASISAVRSVVVTVQIALNSAACGAERCQQRQRSHSSAH